MKIVIDIPEDYYEIIKHDAKVCHNDFKPYNIIANGIPLPKCHGRLIDADKLKKTQHDIYIASIGYRHRCISAENIDEAPTIIPAESEDDNDKT